MFSPKWSIYTGGTTSQRLMTTPALLNLPTHTKGGTQLHNDVPPQDWPAYQLKGMHLLKNMTCPVIKWLYYDYDIHKLV